MANDLTKPAASTAIRCSTRSLENALPRWIDIGQLDGCRAGYGLPIPSDQGSALRVAAAEHHRALAACGIDGAHNVLVALRASTLACADSEAEALASFKLLRSHMADVPLDILEAACRAYCLQPGRRFYPRAAGELRAFTDPMIRRRAGRAVALLRMAEIADAADAEACRLAEDPCTPEMIARIKAEFGMGATPGGLGAGTLDRVTRIATAA